MHLILSGQKSLKSLIIMRMLARTPQNFHLLGGMTVYFSELKTQQPIMHIHLSGYVFLIHAYTSSSILPTREDMLAVINVTKLLLGNGLSQG